ncbi:uncharacterized protein BDR25DRAFT_312752 [Lindgomyces ingoldianus]|uniref:Uncharacterized protein n=1 Tax=Lindgomyces ingoldianus TaxID=673940 RepID=A0ACB6R155_9PLEO|nr:uncharacterized protein BDR25DRAFT_312752 [Lindgomyces ingoldianus]KAF2472871.1 hypothetical protein BDR25DRAFT_312752 [Lindgomyces ingoldianus]
MSGYGKSQEPYVYDAAATRPNQAPNYTGYAQPSFASQYPEAQARLPHEPSTAEMPFIPSSTYESRATSSYQVPPSYTDAPSRHPAAEAEITNAVTPSQGTAGSTILLHLRTTYELTEDPPTFIFMFGSKRCVAALRKIDQVGEKYNYALSVDVPPFPTTNSWNPTMMLQLRTEDKFGRLIQEADAGGFTYTDMSPNLAYQSSPEIARKRKFSTEFGDQDFAEASAKRSNTMRIQAKPRSVSAAYSAASASPLPVQPSPNAYGYPGGYDLPKQSSYTPQLSQKGIYAVSSGISIPQTEMKPPPMSPNLSSYNPYPSLAQTGRSPHSIAATPARSSVMPSPSALPTPVLVRATTLPQASSGAGGQPFNPYLIYPSKAVLKIEGDLDKMSEEWTREEFEAKRRLVQFERSQSGSTIAATFAAVTPEARPQRSICVSCILWEDKDECFITSVDTIYLLEQLVNVRFTVEEKNRIRRNLEGFRPLTVSKAKADSEEFFKIIMGFPNPKPRNIEKDVKVFPWKILSHALKKIISKYSASYSSTAGAGSLPTTSAPYLPVGMPQTTGDVYRNTSPRSVASSAASTAYTPSMTSTSLSPNPKTSAGLEVSAGQGMSVPQRDPTGQGMTQWGATHHQLPQYSGRPWDYGAYINASAATGVPSAVQSMQMQQPEVTPDLSQIPGDTPYQQYDQRTTRV